MDEVKLKYLEAQADSNERKIFNYAIPAIVGGVGAYTFPPRFVKSPTLKNFVLPGVGVGLGLLLGYNLNKVDKLKGDLAKRILDNPNDIKAINKLRDITIAEDSDEYSPKDTEERLIFESFQKQASLSPLSKKILISLGLLGSGFYLGSRWENRKKQDFLQKALLNRELARYQDVAANRL